VKVFLSGPGIFKSAPTDATGHARISVKPTRAGILRVSVPSHKTCTRAQIGMFKVPPPVAG
jgi:hypothetical protein